MNSENLVQKILDFMVLRSGVSVKDVINKIVSPETDKHSSDYYRQGSWGGKQARALNKLKNDII